MRSLGKIALAFVVCLTVCLPALAADDVKTDATPDTKADTKTESKAVKPASKKSDSTVALPTRMASFVVGAVFGTPIAIVRKMGSETVQATRDLVGDTNNPLLLGAAGVLGVPAGILSGTAEGILYGVKNSWVGSGDEPFGKDSFSLGDM